VDLHTLSSILTYCGISSNNAQKKNTSLCKRLTNNKLHSLYEQIFEACAGQALRELLAKDSSELSRTLVTFILDDSVFKQWLTSQTSGLSPENQQYYARFFSGQVQQAVWGYQVVTLGVNIGDIFYPLYFECVRKTDESVRIAQQKHKQITADWHEKCKERVLLLATIKEKKAEVHTDEEKLALKELKKDFKALNIEIKALKQKVKSSKPPKTLCQKHLVAQKLLEKAGDFLKKLKKDLPDTPIFHFSCDSGYSNKELLETCSANHLNYISVPKKSHFLTIDGKKTTLKTLIDTRFLPAEAAAKAQSLTDKGAEDPHFELRLRGYYPAIDTDVTILLFRLPKSKNVSVIYSPSKTIFTKTLRRHWFARTQIEQFFKLLKHYMKSEEARPREKHRFEYNLLRFAHIALEIQQLIRFLRRKRLLSQCAGLGTLRTLLASTSFIKDRLISLLK
jgi:hypothetical protein